MKTPLLFLAAAMSVGLGACSTRDTSHNASQDTTQSATPNAMSNMPGMSGDTGQTASPSQSASQMTAMQQHLQQVSTLSADSLRTILPTHRQMVANLIATMNGEMQNMHMSGDAAWQATVDSLRNDLVHAPTMGATELKAFFPAHTQRVTRLMQMHHDMMASMKM